MDDEPWHCNLAQFENLYKVFCINLYVLYNVSGPALHASVSLRQLDLTVIHGEYL